MRHRLARRLARLPFRESAVLRQRGPGSFNDYGEFVPGAVDEIEIVCATAPLEGEDRQVLPEGLRERNVRTFWLQEDVNAVVEGASGTVGDSILFEGKTFQIIHAESWSGFSVAQGVAQ